MLADLQKQFFESLIHADKTVLRSISSKGKLKPADRIDIYRTNVKSLHVSVLMNVFPVCEKILGENYFKQIAIKYVKENPSHSYDLNHYGDSFPNYLQKLISQRLELAEYQYLGDLAQLEWQIQEVYFSADKVKLNMPILQSMCTDKAGEMIFTLQACVSILDSKYPIGDLWYMHQSDETSKIETDIDDQHQYLCVYRDQYQVSLKKINADLYQLMEQIKQKSTLAKIAEVFSDSDRLNSALVQLIEYEWLKCE